MINLFIFRRDLRLDDNLGLINLLSLEENVVPIFIFTPEQVGAKNEYRSDASIQFMIESLKELNKTRKIHFFYGHYLDVLHDLIKNNTINSISFNMDYTPYARHRDKEITDLAEKNNIKMHVFEDILLNPINAILTDQGHPYTKYTPFYNKSVKYNSKNHPTRLTNISKKMEDNFYNGELKGMKKWSITLKKAEQFYKSNPNRVVFGGRLEGLKVLSHFDKFMDYNKIRNDPNRPTTRLSAHLKFGTISARHVYWTIRDKLGDKHGLELLKQIYWRDFYTNVLWYHPEIVKGVASRPEMRNLKWHYSESDFQAWCDGRTGIPIVDAGMRELNTTGFMHNRLRMVVATFLIFNLGIDWQWGERYFAQKLVDADWANNRGNWQWTAGTEKWSNDYFRALAMPSQLLRFDPEATYVKQWCPELKSIPAKDLANWDITYVKYPELKGKYPEPIVKDLKASRLDGIGRIKDAIKKYMKK